MGILIRKVIKSFTFWFVLIAIFEIFMHQIGQDSKNIILIHLNLMLRMIYKNDSLLMFMDSGMEITCRIISETISIYWYIASVFSFFIYGIILDAARVIKTNITNIANEKNMKYR